MSKAQKINDFLSSAKLLHFTLPVLMVYLILGTVAQKYIGLYQATNIFFAAPIIWVYDVFPLPGMPVIVAMIFVNLLFKIIFKSPWKKHNAGIILTHIGAMLLLLGGLFTALYSSEGYMDLVESETSAIVSDYHDREFVIVNEETNEVVERYDHAQLYEGQHIKFNTFPIDIKILEYCQNCEITARSEEEKTPAHQSMALHMKLVAKEKEKNDEENFAGMAFSYSLGKFKQIHTILEEVPQHPRITIENVNYRFELRRAQRVLPFEVQLLDFKKENYPGTQMAKSYSSRVLIKDNGTSWESVISMNEPLRYKGYTFFQSSFARTQSGEDVSVLAVVWNAGRAFPYISGIVMCIGLLMHLFIRKRKNIVLLAFMMMVSMPSYAADIAQSFEKLAQTPVLHEGRIKPLDSFARANLKDFSGKEDGAMLWLVQTIFDPARAEDVPILKIVNPDIRILLNLEKRESKLYSSREVLAGILPRREMIEELLRQDENKLSPQQRDLLIVHRQLSDLQDIFSSISHYLPLSLDIPADVPEPLSQFTGKNISLSDITPYREQLENALKGIIETKGNNLDAYNEGEQILAHLSYTSGLLSEAGSQSLLLKSIPVGENEMVTPWQAELQQRGDTQITSIWKDLARSYHETDKQAWHDNIDRLHDYYYADKSFEFRTDALLVEYYYNKYTPFYASFVLCLIALGVLVIGAFTQKAAFLKSLLSPLLTMSIILQTAGISARIFILDRPPVSTLYETVLFVCALAMFYMVIMYWRHKKALWVWLCVCLGLILHILGFSHDQDGDSFVVLTAVLNTNFWLTTHVLCITAGYAFCAITSVLAHYALINMAVKRDDKPNKDLMGHIKIAALIALFLATIGTVLGGIWADQSWGRFWGWDPKENGALLIVLWLVWVLHGKISEQMSTIPYLCGLAYLSIILAISWFGVNLLNVGLHSYGFTDSMAGVLGAFILAETLFLSFIAIAINKRSKNA